jgi:uncharacterized membrane protein
VVLGEAAEAVSQAEVLVAIGKYLAWRRPDLISEAESEAIGRATEKAERSSAADIVTVLVHESDSYPEVGLYSAVSVWVLVEIVCLLFSDLGLSLLGPGFTLYAPPAAFLAGLCVGRWNPIRRLWLPDFRPVPSEGKCRLASFPQPSIVVTKAAANPCDLFVSRS